MADKRFWRNEDENGKGLNSLVSEMINENGDGQRGVGCGGCGGVRTFVMVV